MNARSVPVFVIAAAMLVSACAETTPPLPPPEEVLLVVNSTEATLSYVPVDNTGSSSKIPLGGTAPTPVGVSAREGTALVPLGLDNAAAVVDLRSRSVIRLIPLEAGSGATGSVIVNDSIGYVANPGLNTITRVHLLRGDTASVAVGQYPQGIVYTRGRLFVINGNLVDCPPPDFLCRNGPSWLTVVDPVTNARSTGVDSIPLLGPGNAQFGVVGSDGLLYVMNAGGYAAPEARLSIVDPVGREEVASFGDFGAAPGSMAVSGDQLYISSFTEGIMQFDTRTRTVVRGAGDGVQVNGNSAVETDSQGRIYGIDSGPCQGGIAGQAMVFRPDFTSQGQVTLGECAFGTAVTKIQNGE